MDNIDFKFTSDGSLGLYNKIVEDVYHASSGAYSESYEKFIIPSNFNQLFNEKDEINLLDICYGIGYNTKTAINELIKKYKNKGKKINITSIEIDKNLVFLSPFVKVPQYNDFIKEITCYFIANTYKEDFTNYIKSIKNNKLYRNYLDNNIYIDNVINGENIEEPNYNKELLEEKPEKPKRVRKATVEDILAKIEKERSSKKM